MNDLERQFGHIDIYLFDQLLRGRIAPGMTVLDAGCGSGRNLVYLLQAGYNVLAADGSPDAIAEVRAMAARLAPRLPPENFRAEPVEAMSFADGSADVVLSNAVLHFARDDAHFRAMLDGMWRKLKKGGLFFSRLASSIGIESEVQAIGAGHYRLPDGSDRYLVDEPRLMRSGEELGGQLLDPIKTTVVQHQRAMTTWVMVKR
jgi:tellurite methyltransferase